MPEAWLAIKKVWASKFNERAFVSTRKIGLKIENIFMSVLVMRIIPAQQAFVIHTVNPINNSTDQVYVEACDGLGEALVSDFPG
jgi:alpha-glucan,water dikinase